MRLRFLFISLCLLLAVACQKEDKVNTEAVDMTSSKTYHATVLWATCNLGATSPEKPGEYYTWGDDPCPKLLGAGWRMPTREEFTDLLNACTIEYVQYADQNWVVGCKLTSKKTGNSLFFPVFGYKDESGKTVDYNQKGYYWTSTPVGDAPGDAYSVKFNLENPLSEKKAYNKIYSLQIRPVREQ